jgi:hypothetical protein
MRQSAGHIYVPHENEIFVKLARMSEYENTQLEKS